MMRFLTFIFLITFLSLSEQSFHCKSHAGKGVAVKEDDSGPRPPPADYEYFPGIGYYKLVNQRQTFKNAMLTCERDGGHLAIINSMDEANALMTLYGKVYKPGQEWPTLGFGDFFERGEFRTVFGEHISSTGYAYWYPGEPDTFFDRNCGCLDIGGGMATHCCDCERMFFCEIEIPGPEVSKECTA